MLDVQAERGGIVLGLIDVPREEISKYGCVELAEGRPRRRRRRASSTWSRSRSRKRRRARSPIIGRYVLPPEIFDALRATEPGAGGEIQLTDAMRALVRQGVPVHGVVFRGRRYDTGDRLDYLQATRAACPATPRHRRRVHRVAAGVCRDDG